MTARTPPPGQDSAGPAAPNSFTIIVDGDPVTVRDGQSIAAALLAGGRLSWRSTARGGRPRGVFCGIGVCFDCLVTVNDVSDVRACLRRARDGDVVVGQDHRDGERR